LLRRGTSAVLLVSRSIVCGGGGSIPTWQPLARAVVSRVFLRCRAAGLPREECQSCERVRQVSVAQQPPRNRRRLRIVNDGTGTTGGLDDRLRHPVSSDPHTVSA